VTPVQQARAFPTASTHLTGKQAISTPDISGSEEEQSAK